MQASVELIGHNLGIENPILSKEHIAKLEAASVTHEWESLAICTAILLMHIWRTEPEVRIPKNINLIPGQFFIQGEDYFSGFLQNIKLNGEPPTAFMEHLLLEQEPSLNLEQREYLKGILRNGQNHDLSFTLPIFQEYVLGSKSYSQIYNRPSQLNTESYLELYDQAALSQTTHDQLIKWVKSEDHHAVVFTNRPSTPPNGFFSTPEAELGLKAIGLQELPIVGAGSLFWLANLAAKPLNMYLKPSPVHALAAIQVALGTPHTASLKLALDFFCGRYEKEKWGPLDGSTIVVFEDLIGGLRSAKDAKELLEKYGVRIEMILVGITKHPTKAKSLSQVAYHVVEDINNKYLREILTC
ncbi:MAG: hypothetical protein H8E29_17070 [Anaerolineales bacterium]|uniref:Uncharacterized protein n=1 Tax=Candidatus Desulfolinea nitratireducens TaxID=2841698 RepID=A0A8J6NSW9_9CHLR|nr:hypothetical protein [Candidatus Desulfolinea nitratireducens]